MGMWQDESSAPAGTRSFLRNPVENSALLFLLGPLQRQVAVACPIQLDKIQGQPNKPLCVLCNGFALFKAGTDLKFSISGCAPASSLR